MATSFLQKLRLALRGWSRRRDDDAKRREQEFLARNVNWGKPAPAAPAAAVRASAPAIAIDLEGLQCAYLDESGQIAYYLDTQSGEVIEIRGGAAPAADRYERVPARSAQSDESDRRAFAAEHETLAASVHDAAAFRRALAADRALEKAWYRFKNDRATEAIAAWLRGLGS